MAQRQTCLFLDLGPVFEEWKADFGRTFVIGSDPVKRRLHVDISSAFAEGKRYFKDYPDITGRELYLYVQSLAGKYGWEFGGRIAGHLIGEFPHERMQGDKITLYVHPENSNRLRDRDAEGRERHWILEIHFVDRVRKIGGFYEGLLTVG
jgi:Xaa-Pro aminopeptidase